MPDTPDPTPPRSAEEDLTARMSFLEHLVELRKRLLHSLAYIGVGLVVGLTISDRAFGFLAEPMLKALRDAHVIDRLVYTSPIGPITLYITVGLYLGLVLALPFVLYQVWLFVAPGLYRHERSAVAWFIGSAMILFLCGTAFGYYIMLPTSLKFLLSIQGPFTPMISINEYFDLSLIILIGLGLVFQLPILIFFLSLFGVVTPKFLWVNVRYAILIIAVVAAIATPTTDALTMLIFMAPMIVLYFVGIGVSALVVRNKKNRSKDEPARAAASQ